MKKFIIPILLLLMIIPFEVGAKEYCKVVSGNGKDIGSEISCGTEHFYIIDSNENEIKMLSKYNLYTGTIIYKETIEKELNDDRTDAEFCNDLAISKGGKNKRDGFYDIPGYCFYELEINSDKIIQSEEAIGAHQDKDGNYLYPQVGDVYISPNNAFVIDNNYINGEVNSFYNYTIDTSVNDSSSVIDGHNTSVASRFLSYKNILQEMGYEVIDIGMLSLTEFNKIVEKTSNKTIPINEWGNIIYQSNFDLYSAEFGNIKPYILDKYSWLYSTTYWTSTIFKVANGFPNNIYFMFIAEQGKLCGAGANVCLPKTNIGCGLRPVITIPKNDLKYLIKAKTDGHGAIEVVENSIGGEIIQFRVSINKGYKYGSIIITTDSGEKVEFTKGDITKNDDGTFSIDKNKFTMPFESITIQAKFESENILKNPETGDKLLFIIFTLVTSIVIGTFIYKKKESRYNV